MINDMIREVLASTGLSSPREVAQELLLAHISPDEYATVLAEVLPSYVQTAFSRNRLLNKAATGAPGAPAGSAKVTAVRDSWAAQKATPLLVGGQWKRLGECTASDLLVVAATLRERAQSVLDKAKWYENLAAALPSGATVDSLEDKPE